MIDRVLAARAEKRETQPEAFARFDLQYLRGFDAKELSINGIATGVLALIFYGIVGTASVHAFISLVLAGSPMYLCLVWAKRYQRLHWRMSPVIFLTFMVTSVSALLATMYHIRFGLHALNLSLGSTMLFAIHWAFALWFVAVSIWIARIRQKKANLRHEAEQKLHLERALLAAELKALQAQIEPHFLFNTLANLKALMRIDTPVAEQMLEQLVAYLRASLPTFKQDLSTIEHECELVRHYLSLIAFRFGKRFSYQVNYDAALANHSIPPLMLITLVENAIKHGVEQKTGVVFVHVNVSLVREKISLSVTDNGHGLKPNAESKGIGLSNIRERLQRLYGDHASLMLTSNASGGVTASIELPLAVRDPTKANDIRAMEP